MPLQTVFPLHIYESKISGHQDLLPTLYELRRQSQETAPHALIRGEGYSSYSDHPDLLRMPGLERLRELIVTEIKAFLQDLFDLGLCQHPGNRYGLANSWFNTYTVNSGVWPHAHGASLYTGVYNVTSNEADLLCLENPLQQEHFKQFTGTPAQLELPCKSGQLYMFPGFLKHYTKKKDLDHERVIISFNVGVAQDNNDFVCRL